jgi:hypothetical protein
VNIAGLGGLGAGATAALPASTAITAATAASWNAASGADEAAAPDDSSLTTTGTTSMDFASSALAGFFHDGGPFDADEPPPALAGAGRKEVRMRRAIDIYKNKNAALNESGGGSFSVKATETREGYYYIILFQFLKFFSFSSHGQHHFDNPWRRWNNHPCFPFA